MHKKVIVLLAAYNGDAYLAEQLDSILSQQNIATQVFVSLDRSIDDTECLLDQYTKQDARLKVLSHGHTFGSAAKNFFRLVRDVNLAEIEFDYLAFSDQDDIWNPDKLERATAALISQKVAAYSSNVYAFWSSGQKTIINKAQPQTPYDFMFESAGPGCTFVLRRDLAMDIQAFLKKHQQTCDHIALHDWFIYAYARSKNYRWYIDPEPTMLYRQHDNNVVGANRGLKPMLARLSKIRNGWYDSQIKLIAQTLGYQHMWPIQLLTRLAFKDRITLALHTRQFRRRLRDQIAFAIYVLLLAKK